jgi:hypothetical protein
VVPSRRHEQPHHCPDTVVGEAQPGVEHRLRIDAGAQPRLQFRAVELQRGIAREPQSVGVAPHLHARGHERHVPGYVGHGAGLILAKPGLAAATHLVQHHAEPGPVLTAQWMDDATLALKVGHGEVHTAPMAFGSGNAHHVLGQGRWARVEGCRWLGVDRLIVGSQ